jgi:hypothetical protein
VVLKSIASNTVALVRDVRITVTHNLARNRKAGMRDRKVDHRMTLRTVGLEVNEATAMNEATNKAKAVRMEIADRLDQKSIARTPGAVKRQ